MAFDDYLAQVLNEKIKWDDVYVELHTGTPPSLHLGDLLEPAVAFEVPHRFGDWATVEEATGFHYAQSSKLIVKREGWRERKEQLEEASALREKRDEIVSRFRA